MLYAKIGTSSASTPMSDCASDEFRHGRSFPALEDGTMIAERPKATPNPVVEVREHLVDGTSVKAVWAWLKRSRTAKLVTVHFFELGA
jgi:hypothetical protein